MVGFVVVGFVMVGLVGGGVRSVRAAGGKLFLWSVD